MSEKRPYVLSLSDEAVEKIREIATKYDTTADQVVEGLILAASV